MVQDKEFEEQPDVQTGDNLTEEPAIQNSGEAPTTPMPAPVAPQSSKWRWIGSPKVAKSKDGISDLFHVRQKDMDGGVDDAVSVDRDEMLGANSEGDLSDLTDVFEEDIMGMPGMGQRPSDKFLRQKRHAKKLRQQQSSETSMGRISQ